jgi:selenophosphate synthase
MNPELREYRHKVAQEVAKQSGISTDLASHTISKFPEWEKQIQTGCVTKATPAKVASKIIFS